MVDYLEPGLDALFHALADPTRRAMLARLADGARTVGDLAQPFPMSLAAASKHVQVLERAGLLRREVIGRSHRCHLQAAPLHAGAEWLHHYRQFWSARLDALERALADPPAASGATGGTSPAGPPKPGEHPSTRRSRAPNIRTS